MCVGFELASTYDVSARFFGQGLGEHGYGTVDGFDDLGYGVASHLSRHAYGIIEGGAAVGGGVEGLIDVEGCSVVMPCEHDLGLEELVGHVDGGFLVAVWLGGIEGYGFIEVGSG